jgi:hypothetical protein
MTDYIYKGDNTEAFDNKFLTIDVENINNLTISKAEFRCGKIIKTFKNPTFPIDINLTEIETKMLQTSNNCYLAIYDEKGRKKTCEGTIRIDAKNEVV